jgi:protein-disulfide isomerase
MRCLKPLAAAVFAVAVAGFAHAGEFSGAQKTEIEKIVRSYLTGNPEVIKEAIEELEKRQKLAEADSRDRAIKKDADKITNSTFQTVVGNPAGDVTLVEFFDYNCGYCKRSVGDVAKLIEGDPKLRVVLKDFPILGTGSLEAAQVASALREQFKDLKLWEFHKKLLGVRGSIGEEQALAVAKELGADMAKLKTDMKSPSVQAGLKEVAALADELHFEGTPSWVIGSEAFVGGVPFAALKSKIENVRKCGKSAC